MPDEIRLGYVSPLKALSANTLCAITAVSGDPGDLEREVDLPPVPFVHNRAAAAALQIRNVVP